MLIATTGAEIARWLRRDDAAGVFFRRCLRDWLKEQGLGESALLLRQGRLFQRKINNAFVAQASLWGGIVWTLAKLGVTLDEDWAKWTLKDLLVVPYAYVAFGESPRFLSVENFIGGAQKYHFELWGDMVWWFCVYEFHYKPHGSATRPLSAPPTHALRLHEHKPRLRCRDPPWQAVSKMARVVWVDWKRWFTTLPEAVQKLLHEEQMQFGKHPDRYECTRNARGHTRPFDWDFDALEFPWHLVKLAGMRLDEYTVKDARKAPAPREPIRPDWKVDDASDAEWLHLWTHSLAKPLHLDDAAHSRVRMFNHNRARTAERFADDERPRDHEEMEVGDDPALMLRYLPADAAEEADQAAYTAVDKSQAGQAQAQSSVAGGAERGVAASQHGNDDEAQGEDEDEREDREARTPYWPTKSRPVTQMTRSSSCSPRKRGPPSAAFAPRPSASTATRPSTAS